MEKVLEYIKLCSDPKFTEGFVYFCGKITNVINDPNVKSVITVH